MGGPDPGFPRAGAQSPPETVPRARDVGGDRNGASEDAGPNDDSWHGAECLSGSPRPAAAIPKGTPRRAMSRRSDQHLPKLRCGLHRHHALWGRSRGETELLPLGIQDPVHPPGLHPLTRNQARRELNRMQRRDPGLRQPRPQAAAWGRGWRRPGSRLCMRFSSRRAWFRVSGWSPGGWTGSWIPKGRSSVSPRDRPQSA